MKAKIDMKLAWVVAACVAVAIPAKAVIAYTAYQNPTGTYGNVPFSGVSVFNAGMDFTVGTQGIIVTSLGAFDNGQNGFNAPITVAIYRVSDQSIMTSADFAAGNSGNLSGGSRFLDTLDVPLAAGTYRIVAGGYAGSGGVREQLFSEAINPNSITIPTDTGGGLITFGGNYLGIGDGIAFPTDAGPSTIPGFAAGTFVFTPVPEASQFAVAGVGLLGLVYIGRCAWQRRKVVA